MRNKLHISVASLVFILSSITFAVPASWVGMSGPSNWYSSPVTSGYAYLRLYVESVTFTDAVFTFSYDSAVINTLGTVNVQNLQGGLSLVSVTNENLDGTWKKATIVITGNITMGLVQYQSEAIFRLLLIPVSEGVVPVTLWPNERFPERYNTCSLSLANSGEEVIHEKKEWNDGTELFAFTDKTGATYQYYYDLNFGTPIEGSLTVTYTDDSQDTFYTSDNDKGIMIDNANGAFFVTPQPNGASYTLNLTNYGSYEMSLTGGRYISHIQPDGHLFLDQESGVKAQPEDIKLTVHSFDGIGTNFETSTYSAAIAGEQLGVLDKEFTFAYVDDDTIEITIVGGLEADYYNMYVYKNDAIQGRAWFTASDYYPATFTIVDGNQNPIENALVRFIKWGMEITTVDQYTDENGQATVDLPGDPEWGSFNEYYVVMAGYDTVMDNAVIYDEPISINITMVPAQGTDLEDLAVFAASWQGVDCFWYNNCEGADMNYDGNVDPQDLMLFAARWLKTIE